jgi:hypothetical protein
MRSGENQEGMIWRGCISMAEMGMIQQMSKLGTNLTIVKSRGRHAHFFHNGHLGYHNNMALRML